MSGQTLSLAFIILYTHRYRELASKYLSQNTIPLGLVRGTYGPLPYIIASLPQSSTVLNEEDALYLIADISWAKANLERIYRGGERDTAIEMTDLGSFSDEEIKNVT